MSVYRDSGGSLPGPPAHGMPTSQTQPGPHLDHLELVYGGDLETPADALRLLSSVAGDRNHMSMPRVKSPIPEGLSTGDVWNRWPPVRDGLLTGTEAAILVTL